MRYLLLIMALILSSQVLAHDVGSHCEQFGADHPGCGGDGTGPGPEDGVDIHDNFNDNILGSFNDNFLNAAPIGNVVAPVGNTDSFNQDSSTSDNDAIDVEGDIDIDLERDDINSHNQSNDGIEVDGNFSGNNANNTMDDIVIANSVGTVGDIDNQINCGREASDNNCGEIIVDTGEVANDSYSDSHSSTDGSGNADIDLSDNSVRTSSVISNYNQAFRAPNLSTQLNVTTSHCINFIGIQMTGADEHGAGGIGLGIPIRDKECRLEKAAMLAFQMENYEAGWTAYCHQKSVRHAWVARAKSEGEPRKGRKAHAAKKCLQTGVDTQKTLENVFAELEMLRNELIALEGTDYDDAAIRARIRVLEGVAHLPNRTYLINPDEHVEPEHHTDAGGQESHEEEEHH